MNGVLQSSLPQGPTWSINDHIRGNCDGFEQTAVPCNAQTTMTAQVK